MSAVIGVDPGPTTGIVELLSGGDRCVAGAVVQCNAAAVVPVLDALITGTSETVLAVETFVHGRFAGKREGQATRYLINQIETRYGARSHVAVVGHTAGQVKPWANDERLHRAGLWEVTRGMTHARDAARHALFAAVERGAIDPLSVRRNGS